MQNERGRKCRITGGLRRRSRPGTLTIGEDKGVIASCTWSESVRRIPVHAIRPVCFQGGGIFTVERSDQQARQVVAPNTNNDQHDQRNTRSPNQATQSPCPSE